MQGGTFPSLIQWLGPPEEIFSYPKILGYWVFPLSNSWIIFVRTKVSSGCFRRSWSISRGVLSSSKEIIDRCCIITDQVSVQKVALRLQGFLSAPKKGHKFTWACRYISFFDTVIYESFEMGVYLGFNHAWLSVGWSPTGFLYDPFENILLSRE